ncbi:MAG: hypothetical protein OXJ64_19125 [Boseongicola sp.]|nr:hypothetical protein [Boseongicola sp.]
MLQQTSASGLRTAGCVPQVLELRDALVVERISEVLADLLQEHNNEGAGDVSDPTVS